MRAMASISRGALLAPTPVVAWSTSPLEATPLDGCVDELDDTDRRAARGVEVIEWFPAVVDTLPDERRTPTNSSVVPALTRDDDDEEHTEPKMSDALFREARALGIL